MDNVSIRSGELTQRVELPSGKKVLASDRYKPNDLLDTNFEGRDSELRMILAAWIGGKGFPPLSPLLIGEPGVGKNRIVYEMARLTGLDLYIFQGHEDVTAEDLACSVRFADDSRDGMEYVMSPLVTAMHRGGVCFIDEIGKIRPRALALLVSVLDERRYIDSALLGERVYAMPAFRFVAATNTEEINDLPQFIRSRMRPVIEVGPLPRSEIDKLIANQLQQQDADLDTFRKKFWELWERKKTQPTPRDTIHLLALATSLSIYESTDDAQRNAANLVNSQAKHVSIKPEHLEQAFQELLRQDFA